MRKGKYPFVPSRRRVLDAECYCIKKNYDFISSFSRVGLYL
jgi:hypothetical protein